MKKLLLCCGLLLLVLAGCSGESVEKTLTLSEKITGLKVENEIILSGVGDVLEKSVEKIVFTYDEDYMDAEEVELMKMDLEAYKACPGGIDGDSCSEYVVFDWSMDGNVLITTETVNYMQAAKDRNKIFADVDAIGSDEYYSIEKTMETLIEDGFIEIKEGQD